MTQSIRNKAHIAELSFNSDDQGDDSARKRPLDGPKLAVVGVGGAGGNAVDNMIRLNLDGVNFLVCNTDAQALNQSLCPENQRIHLGIEVTRGLGAGSSPEVGRMAAEASVTEVMDRLEGVHMVFIAAGMGGGTGTGGAPVIARAARDRGILTVGVVTKPFQFEGTQRLKAAEEGIFILQDCVDTLLVIPNQNLFRLATPATTFSQAFAMADDVLYSGVRTFTDLMIKHGLVNLDFSDICTVMKNIKGKAMMGTGEATGEHRATEAAEKAIGCLLLDDVSVKGAKAVLINITGGPDLTLYEVDEAIGRIKQEVDQDAQSSLDPAHIIFGATFDGEMSGSLRVAVVATGIEGGEYVSIPRSTEDEEIEFQTEDFSTFSAPVEEEGMEDFRKLGSAHGDFSFDKQHFSSFSMQEERELFGKETLDPSPTSEAPPAEPFKFSHRAPGRRSFFQRLMNLKKEYMDTPEPVDTLEVRRADSPDSIFGDALDPFNTKRPNSFGGKNGDPSETENLEIPAFLRQKRKNS